MRNEFLQYRDILRCNFIGSGNNFFTIKTVETGGYAQNVVYFENRLLNRIKFRTTIKLIPIYYYKTNTNLFY